MIMAGRLFYLVARFGDVLGTILYLSFNGFAVCMIAITVACAMILPALLLVLRQLTETSEAKTGNGNRP